MGIGWKQRAVKERRGTLARKASFRIQNRKGHFRTLKLNHILQRKFKGSLKVFFSSGNRQKLRKQGEHYPVRVRWRQKALLIDPRKLRPNELPRISIAVIMNTGTAFLLN